MSVNREHDMHRLIDITEWLLLAASSIVVIGIVFFAALVLRLNHPPRD